MGKNKGYSGLIAILFLIAVIACLRCTVSTLAGASRTIQAAEILNRRVQISGKWTAKVKPGSPSTLEIMFLHYSPKYETRMEFESIPVANLSGLNPDASGKRVFAFDLVREAGTFTLKGHMNDDRGSGDWTLSPSQDFISAMEARGYDRLSDEDLYSAAIADMRLKLVDGLRAEGYGNLSFHELFEAVTFGITPEFIRGVKAGGLSNPTFRRLVELKFRDEKH